MSPTPAEIRQMILTIEYMRCVCEHSEGKRKADNFALTIGMSTGIRTNDKLKHLCPDYQSEQFWQEVRQVPMKLGLVTAAELQPTRATRVNASLGSSTPT